MTRLKKIKAVIANDLHIPFQDEVAIELFFQFVKKKSPHQIILLGDICDFYSVSRFDKNPTRIANLQADLDKTLAFLERCRENYTGEIHYIQGNHERRLRKYLWKEAKALSSLRSLELSKLLNFDNIGIMYHEHGYQLGDLFCTHGSLIRKHAGYTARAEFEKNGCTGISAHTHRDGKYTVRNRNGHFAWWENYCLCDLNPEYIEGVANWTQGFSCATLVGNRPYVEQIPILKGAYIYGGRIHKR